jgi:hypothetical protein
MSDDVAKQPAVARSAVEIQRAHDVLTTVLLDPALRERILGGDRNVRAVIAAIDVLCWVLGHAHNVTFEGNVAAIERSMKRLGCVMIDLGSLHPGCDRAAL